MTDPRLEAQIQTLLGKVEDAEKNLISHQAEASRKNITLIDYIRRIAIISSPVQIKVLTETMQLLDIDPVIIAVDPGGANRTVIAPPPGPENHLFILLNLADAAETLNVEDVNAGSLVDIEQGKIGILISDGDDELGEGWIAIDAVSLGGTTESLVGGMVSGNTETGITVTYQSDDGTIDFVLDFGIADDKVLQVDGDPNVGEYAKFTAAGIEGRTAAEQRGDINVEDGADVTDAENVNVAGAVMESDFNATTFLYATADDTPQVITPAEVMAILSGEATADFAMNTHKITGVVDPAANQDAATKKYVDDEVAGAGGGAVKKFCSRYGPSSDEMMNGTYTVVEFDTADREDTDYFTYSSGEITLKEAGDYKISFHVTGEEHALPDDNRWHVYAKLQQKAAAGSFADVAGTLVTGYATSSNESNTVTSVPIIYEAAVNDVIRVLAKGNQSGIQLEANMSRILIEFVD